jgi:HK97 family phage major capsid protein
MHNLEYSPRGALRYGRLTAGMTDDLAFLAGAWFLGINGNKRAADYAKAHGLPIIRAQGEGSNTGGGFLVPAALTGTIIALRETRGVYRAHATITPMSGDAIHVPRRTGGLTAYFTAENAAITESSATWDNVGLAAKKLATLTRSSTDLDEDATIDWGNWFVTEIAYAFAAKEDDCGFNGDGTATYGGIRGITKLLIDGSHDAGKVAATSGHDVFTEIDSVDLTGLISKLPAYALQNAKWYCSQVANALVLCRLAASSGGIVVQTINGKTVPTFLGFPIVVTQVLPQVTTALNGVVMLLFGDLALASTLGERRGVTVARSTERYLELDQVAWRGTERVDIVNHDLGDNSNAGPIVGLVGTT